MAFLKILFSVIVGVLLFIGWTNFSHVTYDTVGSYDIVSGAIIEFFLFTLLLEIMNARQINAYKKEMQSHLKEIETLIRKK